jgi:SAM-dependent methyltransferase
MDQLRPVPSVPQAEQAAQRLYSQSPLVDGYTVAADEPLGDVEAEIADRHLHPGDLLLDLGCGGGREAFGLARRGIRVVGIDACEPLVQRASTAALALPSGCEVSFRTGTLATLDAAPASFDAIWLASELYAEIPRRAARIAQLGRLASFTRPGRPLIVFAHFGCGRRPVRWLLDSPRRVLAPLLPRLVAEPGDRMVRDPIVGGPPFYRHHFDSESEVRAEFAAAGLAVMERISSAFVLRA